MCAADGPLPEVPEATDAEIDMLLDTVNTVLAEPLTRADVIGTFAGLRPLLAGASEGETSDLSRRHAILESPSGLLSVVGGKLTTYRRMAEDAVDAAVTRRLPRGAGLAHQDAAARRRVAARAARRDRRAAALRAALRRRGALRREPSRRAAGRSRRDGAGAAVGRRRRGRPDASTICSTGARGWGSSPRTVRHRRMPRPRRSSGQASTPV